MPRVTHFEIKTNEPEKTIKFYEDIFGWKFEKWQGPMEYWMIMTGDPKSPGIDGGLSIKQEPNELGENTIDVNDIDEYIKKVEEMGGKVVVPKMALPGVGYLAYFVDTQGNRFGLMQEDTSVQP